MVEGFLGNTQYCFTKNTLCAEIQQRAGMGVVFQGTLHTGLSYARVFNPSFGSFVLQAQLSSPAMLLAQRNKTLKFDGATYLFPFSSFNVRAQAGMGYSMYEDAMAKGEVLASDFGLFPGIYRSNRFLALELSYHNTIFTTFRFQQLNPISGKTTLYNTNGYMHMGVNGGININEAIKIQTSLFYYISRDFINLAPYTQNIGFSVGLNYWF